MYETNSSVYNFSEKKTEQKLLVVAYFDLLLLKKMNQIE